MTSDSNLPPSADENDITPDPASRSSDAEALEQVREIIVGAHLRQIDDRFGRIEEMILAHNSRLLNLLDKRIGVVEELIENQAHALERQREENDGALHTLEEKLLQEGRALRAEFDELAVTFDGALQQLRETFSAETNALREGAESLDRDLAELFQSMAARLLKAHG